VLLYFIYYNTKEYDPENETDFGDAINIPQYDIDYAPLEASRKGYSDLCIFFNSTTRLLAILIIFNLVKKGEQVSVVPMIVALSQVRMGNISILLRPSSSKVTSLVFACSKICREARK
jgi:hypothetical protein